MPDNTREELIQNPCSRCFMCDFTKQGECSNPYKECSVCAFIRTLCMEFQSEITKAQEQLLDHLTQIADSEGRIWVETLEAKRREIKGRA